MENVMVFYFYYVEYSCFLFGIMVRDYVVFVIKGKNVF